MDRRDALSRMLRAAVVGATALVSGAASMQAAMPHLRQPRLGRLAYGDPGTHNLDVFLDGRPLDLCFVADDINGWATCIKVDERGWPVRAGKGMGWVEHTLYGNVEFRYKGA